VQTDTGNIWVKLGTPNTIYGVDDTTELKQVVGRFLRNEICFVTVTKGRKWQETTLARPGAQIRLESRLGTVRVTSWSGRHDRKFSLGAV